MTTRTKLSDIAESMDLQTDELPAFLNRETGKIEMINAELLRALEDNDDPQEAIDRYGGIEEDIAIAQEILETGKWVALPSTFDIDDYAIMRDFCASQPDAGLRARLENAMHGSGAFRRFRDAVDRTGLLENWYLFKNGRYLETAKEWCGENGVEYGD